MRFLLPATDPNFQTGQVMTGLRIWSTINHRVCISPEFGFEASFFASVIFSLGFRGHAQGTDYVCFIYSHLVALFEVCATVQSSLRPNNLDYKQGI
jgi:hypothetical protein